MELSLQIKSLLFSFFFGIIFSIVVNLFSNKLYNTRLRYQIINAFIISIVFCLIYFILIKKINNGVIHIYFIFMILFGFINEKRFIKLASRFKKSRLIINFKKKTKKSVK